MPENFEINDGKVKMIIVGDQENGYVVTSGSHPSKYKQQSFPSRSEAQAEARKQLAVLRKEPRG